MFQAASTVLAASIVTAFLLYHWDDPKAFKHPAIVLGSLLVFAILQFLFVLVSLLRFHCRPATLQKHVEGLGDAQFGAGRPSIAIQGSGFKYGYAAGVLQYLYENFETDKGVFLCNSSGVYPAIPVVCSMGPIDWLLRDWPKCYRHWSTRPLGLLLDGTAFMDALWDDYLPEDAHIRATRSLRPILTRLSLEGGADIVSIHTFGSRRFLMEVLKATTGIPLISLRGMWYTLPNMLCIDGAFCTRAVQLDESTVLVSPFSNNKAQGFKYSVSPVKTGTARTPRTWKGLFTKMQEVFVAPPTSVCLEVARSGYNRAKELHSMFVEAGWEPRGAPLGSHPAFQREATATNDRENANDDDVPTGSVG